MMVIIKERTKEIGIRRSIGATPRAIVSQIMLEAIALTLIAGSLGLMTGVFLLELIAGAGLEGDFFQQPEVDIGVAVAALIVLVVFGLFAGLIPALRAVRVNTVDALRAE